MTDARKPIAQGDLLFIPVDAIPADAKPAEAVDGLFIVGHSETGHHHVIEADPTVRFFEDKADPLSAWLDVRTPKGADVKHQRSFDTHKPVKLFGLFKVRRQRERAPEGWRKAQD